MNIVFTKQFQKKLNKFPLHIQNKFDERFRLFCGGKFHILLHNHSIHPIYEHARSINITGDYRAVYTEELGSLLFIEIGTHSELYS